MSDITSGNTYYITNAKAGTAVDLSGQDNKSIIGYPYHGGANQQWTLNWVGNGWTFKSKSGQYLSFDNSSAPQNGTKLTASPQPFTWNIWHDEKDPSTYRIFVHGTDLNWDLYGFGNPAPGTAIQLWRKWAGVHQTWKFNKV